ncbi:polyphosphate polymerase domain-containing protein [Microbacterium betulae]|uniref:Polyphosphate polymerase domain-containing protein n=1 Tax=Microbacterium betulae TaxID=2981139 RepID=A0AA97FEM1_9MICO|nr:polyphosphate polymerase domain-containing protein [Microbacterium sp. AB]WOF22196.1 polyphosphate polymerase domain-containing protein [Microbacterium sp. AB]
MNAATRLSDRFARRFAPIALEDLVAEAELLTRVDRKYLMTADEAVRILDGVDERTRVLEIDGDRASQYGTMYFDTPDLLSYRLAAHGRRRRFKLRSRHYVDTDAAFLEMKTRGSRGTTVKERIEQPADAVDRLTDEGRAYAAEAVESLGLGAAVADALEPTLHTAYRRTTLLLPEGARATVDTELAWTDAWGDGMARPDLVIVETKSSSRASSLDRLLWRGGIRPVGISKFGTGLAAMRPDLPSNKWSRVLRRHFDESAHPALHAA